MTVAIPPSFDVLRALVRGELAASDRARVARWLVENADRRVAAALDALAAEWEDVQRDALLSADAREISSQFWPLFEQGLADIDPEATSSKSGLRLLRASARPAAPLASGASVQVIDFAARRLRIGVAQGTLVLASNDRGEVHQVARGFDYQCDLSEGRVTFWAFGGVTSGNDRGTLAEAIREATRARSVFALRISEDFFEA